MVTDASLHRRDRLKYGNEKANFNHISKLSRHLLKVSKFHILLHLIRIFTDQIIHFYRRINMPDSRAIIQKRHRDKNRAKHDIKRKEKEEKRKKE